MSKRQARIAGRPDLAISCDILEEMKNGVVVQRVSIGKYFWSR